MPVIGHLCEEDHDCTCACLVYNTSCDTYKGRLFMVALCNRSDHIYFHPVSSPLFFSSPKLSGRRLDVYHTSTHGVALVRI